VWVPREMVRQSTQITRPSRYGVGVLISGGHVQRRTLGTRWTSCLKLLQCMSPNYALAESELTSRTTTIPTDAYFVGLMHGIMVHGLGKPKLLLCLVLGIDQ
jgi:hypothetical protein